MYGHSRSDFFRSINGRRLAGLMASASVVTLATAGAALAQAPAPASESVKEIVVTGTRIRGIAPVGANVIGVDKQVMEQAGVANPVQMLREIPQITNLGSDDSRTNGAQRAIANLTLGTAVNLRGLGSEETLTLVDGHRPVATNSEGRFFDINTIPAIALQRIEVVADGSSAIYGSDAMTGVVNLITQRRFKGVETRLRYGSAEGGLNEYQASGLFGYQTDRGGIVGAVEYYDRSNLQASKRASLYTNANTNTFLAYPANFGPSGAPTSGFRDINNNGFLDPGEQTGQPRNNQSAWAGVDVLPLQKRGSAWVYGDYKLADTITLTGEFYWSKRHFRRYNAPSTLNAQSIPANNPYNRTGAAQTVDYSFINDLGAQIVYGNERVWQGVGGLNVDLPNRWRLDLTGSYAKSANDRFTDGGTNAAALATARTSSSTDTALDPFGNGYPSATIRANVLGSLYTHASTLPRTNLFDANIGLNGPLATLPGGDLSLAVGGEHQYSKRVQTLISNGAPAPNVFTYLSNSPPVVTRKVDSVYGEMVAPLIGGANARPGVQRLALSLAVRYDHYNDQQVAANPTLLKQGTTNPKIGFTWDPTKDISVHGSYGKSFRAPVLGDYVFSAPTISGPVLVSPTVAAAYGVPSGNTQAIVVQGGHPGDLGPERAKTWSLGFDFAPTKISGLRASVNYYNIRFSNQISVPADASSLQNLSIVQALVGSTDGIVFPGKGLVIMNPTTAQVQAFLAQGGALSSHVGTPDATMYGAASAPGPGQTVPVYALIDSYSHNAGELRTDGIDFSLQYRWETGWGAVTLGDTFTYVLNYKQALLPSTPLVGYNNQINFPLRFRTRAHARVESHAGLSADLFMNYQNGYWNTLVTPRARISSYTTFDLTLGYAPEIDKGLLKGLRFTLAVQNLLDKDPPYAVVVQGASSQNFDSQGGSAVGRFVSFQVAKRF